MNQRSMQFLERSRIFAREKRCCRIARMFESGMKFIESGQHGTLRPRAYESPTFQGIMLPLAWGFNLNKGRRIVFVAQSVNPGNEPRNLSPSVHIARFVISRRPSKSALRTCETAAASGPVAAVS